MSFGAAAHRARPHGSRCPCGGETFGACCGPLLDGAAAATAVELMRSRFTAFAVGDAGYLLRTWHPMTSPASVDLDAGLRWERLEIVRTAAGGPDDARGIVEFRAHWRASGSGERGVLHETSRFRRAAGGWLYVDGGVDEGAQRR